MTAFSLYTHLGAGQSGGPPQPFTLVGSPARTVDPRPTTCGGCTHTQARTFRKRVKRSWGVKQRKGLRSQPDGVDALAPGERIPSMLRVTAPLPCVCETQHKRAVSDAGVSARGGRGEEKAAYIVSCVRGKNNYKWKRKEDAKRRNTPAAPTTRGRISRAAIHIPPRARRIYDGCVDDDDSDRGAHASSGASSSRVALERHRSSCC
jgi:hypothetical protein